MNGPVFAQLTPVRRRQQQFLALRWAAVGLVLGSVVALVVGFGRWQAGWGVSPALGVAALVVGPLVGAALAYLRRPSWEEAASAVDEHFQLKDRLTTALEFMTNPDPTGYHEMQVGDAVRTLRDLEPTRAVPFRLPRALPWAVGLAAVAVTLLAWPLGMQHAEAAPEALEPILEAADEIDQIAERIEDAAREADDPELARLAAELRQKAAELQQPGVDLKEAMARMSEAQAALNAKLAQFNIAVVDGQLKELGTALTSAAALREAGQALKEGQFDKAAAELEKSENADIDRKEARAAGDKTEKVAKGMRDKGLDKLGDAADKLAKGLKEGNKDNFQQGNRDLRREVRAHERRRRINQLLAMEKEQLSECKNRCQQNTLSWLQRRQQQQQQQQQANQQPKAGSEPGRKESGDPSKLNAGKQRERLTGEQGAGDPTESETEEATDGARQKATRKVRPDDYEKFRKMADQALEREQIPLRRRKVIRDYFQRIRPTNAEETER